MCLQISDDVAGPQHHSKSVNFSHVHFQTNILGESYGLNSTTTVLLLGCSWHWITDGWYAIKIKQKNFQYYLVKQVGCVTPHPSKKKKKSNNLGQCWRLFQGLVEPCGPGRHLVNYHNYLCSYTMIQSLRQWEGMKTKRMFMPIIISTFFFF